MTVMKIMSYPSASYNEKYADLSNPDYLPTPSHMRPILHQENAFRWPHANNPSTDRPSTYNHTPYFQEKTPPRVDFRYADLRYPHEPTRNRHDAASILQYNDQQRLHDFHMQQFQKNTDVRSGQTSTEVRFPTSASPSCLKKPLHDSYDGRTPFEDAHLSHINLPKHSFTPPIDVRHPINSSPYPPPQTNTRTFTETRFTPEPSTEAPTPSSSNQPVYTSKEIALPVLLNQMEKATSPMEKIMKLNVKNETVFSANEKLTDEHDTEKLTSSAECSSTKKTETGKIKNENERKTEEDEKEEKHSTKTLTQELKNEQKTEIGSTSSEKKKSPGSNSPDNGLPSYTAMIAQAILKKEGSKSTLSDIYEYMEKHFPSLERRGTGWRNCVRHTLSLNDCFIKLHRPENGRSCNWAVHPSYFDSFSRGDYRKRRALRKRPRGLQWIDPIMLGGYPFAREHEIMHQELDQQQSPFYHYPQTAPGIWSSPQPLYTNPNIGQASPNHLQHFPQPPPPPMMHPLYPTHPSHHGHLHSNHCSNPDCYCQYNKNNYRIYTP